VTARDAANNTAVATLTVTYTAPDTTPPTVACRAHFRGHVRHQPPRRYGRRHGGRTRRRHQVTWSTTAAQRHRDRHDELVAGGIALLVGTNILTITARDAPTIRAPRS